MSKNKKPFYKTNIGIILILAIVVVGVIYLNPSVIADPYQPILLNWVIMDNQHPETTVVLQPILEKVLKKYESVSNLEYINYFDTDDAKAIPSVFLVSDPELDGKFTHCIQPPCDINLAIIWSNSGTPSAGRCSDGLQIFSCGVIRVQWNNINSDPIDMEQVFQHELGHVLFLEHSDGFWMGEFFTEGQDLSIELLQDRIQAKWGECVEPFPFAGKCEPTVHTQGGV